jgi:hypothetical protein
MSDITEQTMFTLPMDWDQWQAEWREWRSAHPELKTVRKAIPGKNFLADEIIGTFKMPNGRTVELSEVTFPNLVERDPQTGQLSNDYVRGIGLTWVDDRAGTVVHSFAELEAALA